MKTSIDYKRLRTVAVSAAGLILPIWFLYRSGDAGKAPMVALFSGYVFSQRPIITGGALDQPSLQKEFFVFCISIAVLCPFIAFVRWINSGSAQVTRFVFAILSLILLLHPLSVLTLFAYDVSRYVYHMGVTPARLIGLSLAIICYALLLFFGVWAGRLKQKHLFGCQMNTEIYEDGA